MKKTILAAVTLISVVFVGTANAQTTADVTVNIKLQPVYTLVVNPGQNTINLVYTTKNDYANGVSSLAQANHLTVFSTGGFVINAKTGGDFTNAKDAEVIEASTVSVVATDGSAAPVGGDLTYTKQNLSNSDKQIIKSTKGGRDKNFNITYEGAGDDAYINMFSKGRDASENVYKATVTYTIVAD
ncbi:hypothetical protein [Leadbetterella sp. DM7]|uniref:hypothetical protein n=1 Tax=Leadbetterella sp. DM7 TaxID=3235085 RepID=UPI00349E9ACA